MKKSKTEILVVSVTGEDVNCYSSLLWITGWCKGVYCVGSIVLVLKKSVLILINGQKYNWSTFVTTVAGSMQFPNVLKFIFILVVGFLVGKIGIVGVFRTAVLAVSC